MLKQFFLIFFLFPTLSIYGETPFQITLGTDWLAQAEHGGFYQAIAEGLYEKKGLKVQIRQGGPEINGIQLLLAGAVDFYIAPHYVMLNAAQKKLPLISVCAFFQKTIDILMTHPKQGNDTPLALKGKPIFISAPTAASEWSFLAGKFGFTDDQKKPYTHSLIPFLENKQAIQEGILSSEPFLVKKTAGFEPNVFLLADFGFSAYAELLTTTLDFEKTHPAQVKAFIEASIEGWKNYLKDPTKGNALIKQDNPKMSTELLAYAVKKLTQYEVLTGKEAKSKGLGTMSEERWKEFYETLVKNNAIESGIDYKSVFTLKYL